MIDQTAARLALRARARTAVAATTGLQTLSATALGFARPSGSFVSDEFYPGMEIVGVGFNSANNAAASGNPPSGGKIITGVVAGLLTIEGGCVIQSASAGRSLSASLPIRGPQENIEFERESGFPYWLDSFVPATSQMASFPAEGGVMDETGLYFITYFGLAGYGHPAIGKVVDAVKRRFAPGTNLTAGSHTLRIRGGINEPAVRSGQITPLGNGWTSCQITIPWRAFSTNAVAA